ncbi:primosome assembly protein PriA, partial [Micromonospora sp. NPDC005313]
MDVPLPHLDRPFDYLVPEALDADARPGVRVKVRFAGQLVDGWLLERAESSEHPKLAYLEKVVSPVPVLSPEVARLARAVADRYAGSLADVLRLAVPPRHARAEKAVTDAAAPSTDVPAPDGGQAPADGTEPADSPAPAGGAVPALAEVDPRGWRDYPAGPALLRALTDGRPARAVWSALPGEDWA